MNQSRSIRNNGTCTITSSSGYQCACLFGYTGPRCELTINACTANPCRFGTCQQLTPGYYFCQCSPGYTDVNCQTEINECNSNPCLNNGTCIDQVNQFSCSCRVGFSGNVSLLIDTSTHRYPLASVKEHNANWAAFSVVQDHVWITALAL